MPADVNCLLGADLLTVPAEDAAKFVDLEQKRIPVAILVFTGHELDAVGRTHRWTEAARDALCLAVLGGEHAVRTAASRSDRPLLVGILDPDVVRNELLAGN